MLPRTPLGRGVVAVATSLLLVACPDRGKRTTSTPPFVTGSTGTPAAPSSSSSLPPIPTESGQTFGPDQPPLIWVGGRLTDVSESRLVLREAIGSVVRLTRLAGGATSFFHVAGGTWEELAPDVRVEVGQAACIEALMDGATLLALRVFLGAACGPV